MYQRTLLIVNPNSGKKLAHKKLFEIAQLFCGAGTDLSVHITRAPKDAAEVVRARGASRDLIVAFGGDGTLNEVITGALAIRYPGAIGYIPSGTTNDIASSLSIPKDPMKAALAVLSNEPRYLDFGAFNQDRCFAYIASFGAFTEVSYGTDQKAKNAFGYLAYLGTSMSAAAKIRPYHVRVTCDRLEIEDDFILGAVANSHSIAGVVKLRPDQADLTDGVHEMLLVRKTKNPGDFARIVHEVTHGNLESEGLIFLRGSHFVFECDEAIPWGVDGEYAGEHTRAEIRTLHNVIRLIRP